MLNILFEEYKKHKIFVKSYLLLCIVLAFLVGTCSPEITVVKASQETTLESDTLLRLNDEIFGSAVKDMAGDYSDIVSMSTEPFTALMFIGVSQRINKLLGRPVNMSELPVGRTSVLVVIGICLIASKVMKTFSGTKVVGTCTLGTLEKYLGTVCVLGIGLVNTIGLSSASAAKIVSAAVFSNSVPAGSSNVLLGILTSIFSAFMGFMALIVNFIVKTVIKGVEAVQILFSGIPFLSVLCECCKTGLTIFLYVITKVSPRFGYAINIAVFVLLCLIFKPCYKASQYFEKIYLVPFARKLFGISKPVPLMPKHLPKCLRTALKKDKIEPDFILPLFVTAKHATCSLPIRRFDKLWLVNKEGCNYLYFRTAKHGEMKFVFLNNCELQKVYLYKKIRFYEIYTLWNNPENLARKYPRKAFSLVLAKSYSSSIDYLMSSMGYIDVAEIKANTRAEKRELKRARREEMREEFRNMMGSAFSKRAGQS